MERPREDRQGDRIVVHLQGRLDEQQSTEIFQWARRRLEENDVTSFVLDLKEVSFINTAGIALLRDMEQRCSARGIGQRFQGVFDGNPISELGPRPGSDQETISAPA